MLLLFLMHVSVWSQSGSVNPFEIQTEQTTPKSELEDEKVAPNSTTSSSNIPESTTNPFEQVDNQNKEATETPEAAVMNTNSGNPFDISPNFKAKNSKTSQSKTVSKKPKPNLENKKAKADVDSQNKEQVTSQNSGFIFILVVIITVLFAVLLTLFRGYFAKVYQAFINDSQLRSAYREMGSTIILPYIVLYGMFVINASVLLYIVISKNGFYFGDNWQSWFYILVGLLVVFLGKHLMLSFFGSTFPVSKEVKLYNFTIVVFNIILGAIFIPITLLYAYGPDNLLVVLGYLTTSIILLLYVYRSIRVLLIGGKYISSHKFHFFMYLCTAEIAPLLLLIKFISKNVY